MYVNWYFREVLRAFAVHIGVTSMLALVGLVAAGIVYVYRGHFRGPDAAIEQPPPKIHKGPITEGWGAKVKLAPR